ncbi:MAG: hypothetical protein AVDCRST_MAG70-1658 [uncultured Thermomicrobiales bacterium]|uniref:Uncharacterized protein n=1 Tax=uncultured Thermomicrobiales bacterium TaxID=1645740 RepID=A0A6J4UZY2_9BACT|nr:MAG: hypothetical protein AVDCRST_MAG70-1658 [uncultured Thermomicrobiales bacterium]
MTSQDTASAGPNPPCEIGRSHPRDRHRMRPVVGHTGVWECARHGLFARVVPTVEADAVERGDPFPSHDDSPAEVVRQGDERQGGVLMYYRPTA